MKITDVSIKRPIAVLMCVLIVISLGIVALLRIPVDLMPDISSPVAVVMTEYEGAGPLEVENIVTKNIEKAVSTVNNIKSVSSRSNESSSMVIAEFNDGTDMDFATLEMREKIDFVRKKLPDDIGMPVVMKIDPSIMPVAMLGVTGPENDAVMRRMAEEDLSPRFERLEGVAAASVTGGRTREIKVEVSARKAAGLGISLDGIAAALRIENLNQPGGEAMYDESRLLIRTTGEFESIEDIKEVRVVVPGGHTVRLDDIAEITDGYKDEESRTRLNGRSCIGLDIQKESGANTVNVVNAVRKEISALEELYPGIEAELIYDQGGFIEDSINNVWMNVFMGSLLAVIVLLVFLRSTRATGVVAAAIPISIIATFVLLHFTGITLNIISLGGLALGTGMLVDNSIVVLENIFRYRSKGFDSLEASRKGTQQVAGAVTASTLTTVAVFLPVAFIEGLASDMFSDMSITVAFSLMSALAVSFTLVPLLASRMLKQSGKDKSTGNFPEASGGLSGKVSHSAERIYQKVLTFSLHNRTVVILAAVAVFAASTLLFIDAGSEFLPAMDQGQLEVSVELKQGALLEDTDKVVTGIEEYLLEIPEIKKVYSVVGGNTGIARYRQDASRNAATLSCTLSDRKERKRSTSEVAEDIRSSITKMPGVSIRVTEIKSLLGSIFGGGKGGDDITVNITGSDTDVLSELSQQITEEIENVQGIRQINNSLTEGMPEVRIDIDRQKASYYGLSTAAIANTVKTAFEGTVATKYRKEGEEIDIRVILPEDERNSYLRINDLPVATPAGTTVRLKSLAHISIQEGPIGLLRDNQQRSVEITAGVFGRDTGSVNTEIEKLLETLELPAGYSASVAGQYELMMESFGSLKEALILSVFLVYMIMAAQFESLLHPLVIMISVPLAFTGSAAGLAITGRTLNVSSIIGGIMLVGIVVNNAIVLVDYINKLRNGGTGLHEAITEACRVRLRPVMMTALTTILALLPLSIGAGSGGELQAPLATVVVGGLITSTLLTLVVVPVVYSLVEGLRPMKKEQSVLDRPVI